LRGINRRAVMRFVAHPSQICVKKKRGCHSPSFSQCPGETG
jgi:hypothetical protein